MPDLLIVKSLLVRVFLVIHGLICAWRVVEISQNHYGWLILVGLGFLMAETAVVLCFRNGREFQTVAFCIIFYLTCTAPSLWIIHVDTANRKLFRLAENKLSVRTRQAPSLNISDKSQAGLHYVLRTSTPLILSIGHIDCHDKAWLYMEEQHWLDAIQETMLMMLSFIRLLISSEHLTIENSGIVLAVTLINGADLLALSQALQYHDVIMERFWMYIGLVLLTIGLFQFAFIDTDGLTPFVRKKKVSRPQRTSMRRIDFLQDQNLCPLFRSLFVHDGLFLVYRIFLVIQVRCSKPSMIFFLSKNLLVIIRHLHRVYYFSTEQEKNHLFHAFPSSPPSTISSDNGRYQFYEFERRLQRRRPLQRPGEDRREVISRQERQLLHRTLRRLSSIVQGRRPKTPQTVFHFSASSISYPFARRRHDGGRARTAFALYGLPFPTHQVARPPTISSRSSHLAKTLLF